MLGISISLAFRLEFSLKLVKFSKNYARKQKLVFQATDLQADVLGYNVDRLNRSRNFSLDVFENFIRNVEISAIINKSDVRDLNVSNDVQ